MVIKSNLALVFHNLKWQLPLLFILKQTVTSSYTRQCRMNVRDMKRMLCLNVPGSALLL